MANQNLDIPFRPIRITLAACVASILMPGLYSLGGRLHDYIILHAVILMLAALILVILYGATARNVLIRLILATVGAILGVGVLWGVWYGLEVSWPAMLELGKLNPLQIVDRIIALSDQYVYTVEGDFGVSAQGTNVTKVVWALETAAFGLSPFLGALMGQRAIKNLLNAAAQRELARRANR